LKEEFPPEQDWFAKFTMRLDSGYQGFLTDYKYKKAYLPHKKKKDKELTDEQKAENKAGASERIIVEHSIGGLKRFRVLSERARIRDWELFDQIIGVCAGLWNYMLN
jgi:DDE superfamily endonuclease